MPIVMTYRVKDVSAHYVELLNRVAVATLHSIFTVHWIFLPEQIARNKDLGLAT